MGYIILPRNALIKVKVRLKRKLDFSIKSYNLSCLVVFANNRIFDLIVPLATFCVNVRKPFITVYGSKHFVVNSLMKLR